MQIDVRNWKNERVRSLDLEPLVFDYPRKDHLIYEAVCAFRAGGRAGTHKIKNRSEVSGGTKKLWKQKHTGRARMGDNRSPLWRHGGTVHGPVPRDYSWRFPKRMRLNALRSVLSQKLRDGKLVCLDALEVPSHKTRQLEQAVRQGLGLGGTVLMLAVDEPRHLSLAARNHPDFKVVRALGANIVDVLHHETLVVSADAMQQLGEVLSR